MRVIILAAGNSNQMSGTIKCMIKNPLTGKTCLEHALDAFRECEPVVVVGYRATEIMQEYPHLDYVLNANWSVTAPSYSVGLALTDEPCVVVPGDILLGKSLPEYIYEAPDNCVVTRQRENRDENSTNYVVKNGVIHEAYIGMLRDCDDPDGTGIFKVSDTTLLRDFKNNCLKHGNLYIGLNLPYTPDVPVYNLDLRDHEIYEFNTHLDYLNYLQNHKVSL